MGLLSGIGKAVGGVASAITDTIGLTTPKGETDALRGAQSRQDALMQKQLEYQQKLSGEAQAFRDKLPQYKDEAFRVQEDSAKQGLAGDLAGVRKAANSRGLLYSGLRDGAEAGTLGDFYANQSAEKAKINQSAEDVARGMEEKAIGMGMENQQQQQAAQDRIYDMALQARAGKQAGQGGIMGAVGKLGGGLLGGSK